MKIFSTLHSTNRFQALTFWGLWIFSLLFFAFPAQAQSGEIGHGSIRGLISTADGPLAFATVAIANTDFGTTSDENGFFSLRNIPFGNHALHIGFIGYKPLTHQVKITPDSPNLTEVNFSLEESLNILDQIVVTGTKTFKRQTNSPVIVNVLTSEKLEDVQACNLSEGLKFQPGLRVETDCQTCNYTQLRMNGLAGGYAQILVNGRPIFSPLTGLYGLEQLPTNMIERIEVIRGGGSSLYGSSAIGGTVNVITKMPKENITEAGYTFQSINGRASDHIIDLNSTLVSQKKKLGTSLFFNKRSRNWYDHNNDNFSELPLLENISAGLSSKFTPTENQKIELSISYLNEYRYGGEMVDQPAHTALQAEERTHHVWMASADYQINFNDEQSSLIFYAAQQTTDRDHYTGILPDEESDVEAHLANAPYGKSLSTTWQFGGQLNHRLHSFLGGLNTLTFGGEYLLDKTFDEIVAYQYLIDQTTCDLGFFGQSDWEISPQISLLSGMRIDKHNLVDRLIVSPRLSALYKPTLSTQLRVSYGSGFRAPQAFDADLHIAFAGGGVSRVSLSPHLQPERSSSWSASINHDHVTEDFIVGFSLEGFLTNLDRAFILHPIGQDAFGEIFEKQNGSQATVQGMTFELRANYDRKIQLESGFTFQKSEFEQAVEYINELPGIKEFIRTPNIYGFANLRWSPKSAWRGNLNYVFTGPMKVPHFAGAPNQSVDEIFVPPSFSEINAKISYSISLNEEKTQIEFFTGIKNALNSYQSSFDIGKNRDSNFVYGPAAPRTFFIGSKVQF